MLDKERLLQLYPEYKKVLGPYTGKDERKRLILVNKTKEKSDKVLSYSKALLEISIGRVLVGDETTDHIDEDKTNNSLDNLQILSRSENASKSALGNTYLIGYKQTEEHRRSGDKNGQAKITNEQVLFYRRKFTSGELSKKDIISQTGMCDSGVRKFLFGYSFKDVPEKCVRQKVGRPSSKTK